MKATFLPWMVAILLTAASYELIDRPLCEFIQNRHATVGSVHAGAASLSLMKRIARGHSNPWLRLMDWPPLMTALAPLFFLGAIAARKGPLRDLLLMMSVSLLLNFVLKNELKAILGRDWPTSWDPSYHSWIRDHAYGFHPLRLTSLLGGDAVSSFPSGHASTAFAALLPAGLVFRKLLPWCVLAASAEGMLMVVLNYHFLSDVLAGSLLGISCVLATRSVLATGRKGAGQC